MEVLTDLHLRAGVLELLLHHLGVGLGHGLLDGRGRALDQVLRLLQAEAGELADHLHHGHLLVRRVLLQRYGELRLPPDRRAAAPGSSFEKASTRGPLSFGPTDSNDVPASALRASVFLTTRMYTPCFLALARSSVICPTVSPRYSAATTDWAFDATAATSATSAFLSSRLSAIHLSSLPEDHLKPRP